MYSAALGVVWEERLLRSERKDDEVEGMVPLGMMVSDDMLARRPRWVVEVMSEARADLSSADADGGLGRDAGTWRKGGRLTGYA